MADWNKNKVLPSAINGGQEFTKKDNLAINELNAIVNNSFYASEKAQRAEDLAESAVKGNGSIVTINGQIQGEWSADFAEAERQKTLNLCNNEMFEWGDIVSQGKVEQSSTIVIRTKNYIQVKPNTQYFIGIGQNSVSVGLKYYSSKSLSSAVTTKDLSGNGVITVPDGCYYVRICSKMSDGSVNITKQQFYLYEGTTDYGYLEYNGAITHEKDIADVEHIETIYDKSSTDSEINKGYTNGIQFGVEVSFPDMQSKYKGWYFTFHIHGADIRMYTPNINIGNTSTINRIVFACAEQGVGTAIAYGSLNIVYNAIASSGCRYFHCETHTNTIVKNNEKYYISKIEGVLL